MVVSDATTTGTVVVLVEVVPDAAVVVGTAVTSGERSWRATLAATGNTTTRVTAADTATATSTRRT